MTALLKGACKTLFILGMFFFLIGNLSAQAATPIASGETHSGSTITPSQMDMYTFEGTANDRILIDADMTGGALDTEILLIDPDYQDETNTQPGGDLMDHVLH